MDLVKVLEQLRRELDHLNAAIFSLERLQASEVRRGRPPRALAELRRAKAGSADSSQESPVSGRDKGDS